MADHPLVDESGSASTARAGRANWIVRRLYTSNPFYVISAELVFIGLRVSFPRNEGMFETWALTLGLGAYTLLLAITACLLIRLGRVWDDVRSILLLVVLMFLAMSVTFDDTLASQPRFGVACALGGFLFAAGVSEGVLRAIRLALPALFRVPYYLILGLFFLYPAVLVPLLDQPESAALQWALFGFSPVAGLAFLALLPAIRRGPAYVTENGSPWRWPLYPWVLFGLLAFAVCVRANYLCISMHFIERSAVDDSRSSSIFGLYFLVPFLYAICVVLLELALKTRNRSFVRLVLAFPLGLVVLCLVDPPANVVAQRFHSLLMRDLGGSPFFLSLLAALGFYGYAALRRISIAGDFLSVALSALAFVAPGSLGLDDLSNLRLWPLVALGGLQIAMGGRKSESWRSALGAQSLIIAAGGALPAGYSDTERGLVIAHLGLGATLVFGVAYQDLWGVIARRLGALLLFLGCVLAVIDVSAIIPSISPEARCAYAIFAIAIALGYGTLMRDRVYHVAVAASAATWMVMMGWRSYVLLRQFIVGLDLITWGFVSFLLAALISFRKAGGWHKRYSRRVSDRDLLG